MNHLAARLWLLCAAVACSTSDPPGAAETGGGGADGWGTGGSGVSGESGMADPSRDASHIVDGSLDAQNPALPDAGDATNAVDAEDETPGVYSSSARQTAKPLGSTASALGYLEYLPVGYGDGTARPLLVFVHGLAESGNGTSDLAKLITRGPPKLIAENKWPDDRPLVVLSMQHVTDMECASADEVHGFISYALSAYQVDPERVYLTGLSCGAIASWNYIAAHGGSQVAAALLVAGDGRPAWNVAGCALGSVAIWGFHAEGDETIDEGGTVAPVELLKACPRPPAKEARVTIYPGTSHDSWTRTYDLSAGHDVYGWMLGMTR